MLILWHLQGKTFINRDIYQRFNADNGLKGRIEQAPLIQSLG